MKANVRFVTRGSAYGGGNVGICRVIWEKTRVLTFCNKDEASNFKIIFSEILSSSLDLPDF